MIDFTPKTGTETSTTPLSPTRGIGTSTSSANGSTNTKADNHLSSLLNLLKQLPEGKTLQAQVKSSQLLSSTEKTLLEQSNPTLATKLNQQIAKTQDLITNRLQNTEPLTNKALTNTITNNVGNATKASIQNTNLFLAKLLVSQPNGQAQLITTVTPQALKINESVLIGQRNQQLLIDRSPEQKVQQAITETIKQILPKQQSTHLLQQFIQQLSQLPKTLQTQLLTKTTLTAIQQLSNFTHSAKTLENNQAVKQAITNSGTQLEAKIQSRQFINNDFRTLLDNINTRIVNNKPTTPLNYSPSQVNVAPPTADGKLNLSPKEAEKIASVLLSVLPSNTAPTTSTPHQVVNPQTATAALLRLLGVPLPPENPSLQALPKIIEQHLKQLIEKTQARIQLNQLRALNLDKPLSENRSSTIQQFHTELPLRFNEQVLPVQITIQEQEYKNREEKDEAEDNQNGEKANTEKRWQVFMSFDLPDNETLHTRVNIIESAVSATLWAESSSLCNKANQRMVFLRDKLLANGLTVEDLVCIHGKPPQQDFSLDYNLVDIKT